MNYDKNYSLCGLKSYCNCKFLEEIVTLSDDQTARRRLELIAYNELLNLSSGNKNHNLLDYLKFCYFIFGDKKNTSISINSFTYYNRGEPSHLNKS